MTKKLLIAGLAAIAINIGATGYAAVAGAHEAKVDCARDHGNVEHHECVRQGHVLFGVPL